MMRSTMLIATIVIFVCQSVFAAKIQVPPNVILILADDMAVGDLSFLNGGVSSTPHLDRLKDEGLWFERAYAGSPVCAPSRAALLTGRTPHRTGVVTLNMVKYPELTRLHEDETTLAAVFAANGYRTGLVGKWHTGIGAGDGPMRRGFQEFAGFSGSSKTRYFEYAIQTEDAMSRPKEKTDRYLTDELNALAIDFVRRHAGQPFFLHLAHYAPHRPLEAPEDDIQRYVAAGHNRETATVYAMIEIMDRGIGELFDELDTLGLRERTLVIFASDNGPDPLVGERFNLQLQGTKYQTWEGGIRVPMIACWPGVISPGTCEDIVHFTDIFPTLVNMCELEFKPRLLLDGVSLADRMLGRGVVPAMRRFWQWNRGVPNYTHNAAMREGQWKLIRPYQTRDDNPSDSTAGVELYDLDRDPTESMNVADDHPMVAKLMAEALVEWSRKVELDRTRRQSAD